MPLRPHAILRLRDALFSGGAHLTERGDTGLLAMLKGLAERPPICAHDDDYTVSVDDEGAVLELNPDGGSLTLTLPIDLPVGFFATVRQVSTGTVTIEAGAGASLVAVGASASVDLAGRWASAGIEVRAADSWHVAGQLA